MRRFLTGMAAALPAFLLGVAVGMLSHRPSPRPPESSASRIASGAGSVRSRPDFAEVFRGFNYVGSSLYRTERDACPYGLDESWPLPESFPEVNRMYVFHYRDAGKPSPFYALQERLRSLGFEADLSNIIYTGMRPHPGILYFQGKGYVGDIKVGAHCTRSMWEEGAPACEVSDYVLTFSRMQ